MTQKEKETIIAEIKRLKKICNQAMSHSFTTESLVNMGKVEVLNKVHAFISSLPTEDYPMPEDTVIFQKGVAEGRRLEREDAKWSEEDEKMKERIITRLNWIIYNTKTEGISLIALFDEVDWLKSLRPSWKPSEEQIGALESAVKLYKDTHFEVHHKKIVSLYEDLKKL